MEISTEQLLRQLTEASGRINAIISDSSAADPHYDDYFVISAAIANSIVKLRGLDRPETPEIRQEPILSAPPERHPEAIYYSFKNAVLRFSERESFVLLRGSRICPEAAPSIPPVSARMRNVLYERTDRHEAGNGEWYFEEDISLRRCNDGKKVSASAAASVLCGYSVSGGRQLVPLTEEEAMQRLADIRARE